MVKISTIKQLSEMEALIIKTQGKPERYEMRGLHVRKHVNQISINMTFYICTVHRVRFWSLGNGRVSRVEGHRSRVEGYRSRVEGHRSRFESRGSKVEIQGSKMGNISFLLNISRILHFWHLLSKF
jgi:hypothetical protein